MAIVGGFLGGTPPYIPAGYGIASVIWVTEDEQHMQGATVTLSGTAGTFSEVTDSNGSASLTVPAGTYTATIEHSGEYYGDSPRTVTIESRMATQIIWVGTTSSAGINVINNLNPDDLQYVLTSSTGETAGSGLVGSILSVTCKAGAYVLKLSLYGDETEIDVSVSNDFSTVDLSEYMAKVKINSTNFTPDATALYNGFEIEPDEEVGILCTTSTRSCSFGNIPSYSGLKTDNICDPVPQSIVPSSANSLYDTTPGVNGKIILITESGSLTIPSGRYETLLVGGGGGGGCCWNDSNGYKFAGGGGGARMTYRENLALGGTYSILVGAGGSGGSGGTAAGSGGVTSISGAVSVSGGSAGSNGARNKAGDGGANGGGGGAAYDNYTGYSYVAGNGASGGSYNGGGGGGGGLNTAGTGGSSSLGEGGAGAAGSSSAAEDGTDGSAVSDPDSVLHGSDYSGGERGTTSANAHGAPGGGGGGGYDSKGGDGGDVDRTSRGGGGGGGGGVAGGQGGRGHGYGGYGYGAGGGGGYKFSSYNYGAYGGGGAGGCTFTKLSGNGDDTSGGAGAPGCIKMRYVSA